MQQAVDQQLRFKFAPPGVQRPSHPALVALYCNIEHDLTPFDLGQCESKPWAQKYAPKRAEEVLQAGQEALILCDWLEKSIVTAVLTGSGQPSASGPPNSTKPASGRSDRKKRRRKPDDLNDFLVSSDDEDDKLEELVEVEDAQPLSCRKGNGSTLVRGGLQVLQHPPGFRKTSNAILLSGPHGSGKTAAVYAVAQQLGFEVFEINSGTRRSGRDILDRIGDMTDNHLVQRVSKMLEGPKAAGSTDIPCEQLTATDSDPKQQGLSSFFGQVTTNKCVQHKKVSSKAKAQLEQLPSRPRKTQKQSVILIEEVDVLFEQDRHFWITIIALAAQSKRPIILTCNDESLIPLENLKLHAILRFIPPPANLAVDYLLLMAAHEGHLLKRDAVETTYEACDHDLRSSIMQLDFWCQMGIGDGKGGLEWIYQRWPPGQDIDADGKTLRVASEGTMIAGMGWFGYDLAAFSSVSDPEPGFELLREARQEWNINDADLQALEWCPDDQSVQQESPLLALEALELRSELRSAADVYSLLCTDSDISVGNKCHFSKEI